MSDTIGNYDEQVMYAVIDYMRARGLNNNGIAGLLGNLYAESHFFTNNAQNSYMNKWHMTDEEYTARVDAGTWVTPDDKKLDFDHDRVGYGLAQWTSEGRKAGFHNYVKSKNVSVGDRDTGIEYVYIELSTGYKKVLAELTSPSNTVRSCAEIVVLKYEVPGSVLHGEDERQKTLDTRTDYAQQFYNKYLADQPTPQPTPAPSTFSIPQIFLTNNDCYKDNWHMTPQGIVVHSTGCNNPYIKRYVQPDDGIIGVNTNNNDWNRPGVEKCVSAFVGKDKNGNVTGRQTLPWDMCTWGCGRGSKGSYNYPATKSHPNDIPYIQFEICEDDLTDEVYFNAAFDYATDLCAYLCKMFNLPVANIVSHKEAADLGMASNHSDPNHWLVKFNKDMNWFRSVVQSKINGSNQSSGSSTTVKEDTKPTVTHTGTVHTVQRHDTISKICRDYKVSKKDLLAINPDITNPSKIEVGQKINIPDKKTDDMQTDGFKVGEKIKLVDGATYYNGKIIPDWVKKSTLYYRGSNKSGAIISILKVGPITGVVSEAYLRHYN